MSTGLTCPARQVLPESCNPPAGSTIAAVAICTDSAPASRLSRHVPPSYRFRRRRSIRSRVPSPPPSQKTAASAPAMPSALPPRKMAPLWHRQTVPTPSASRTVAATLFVIAIPSTNGPTASSSNSMFASSVTWPILIAYGVPPNRRPYPLGNDPGRVHITIDLPVTRRNIRTREIRLDNIRTTLHGPPRTKRVIVRQVLNRPSLLRRPHNRHRQQLCPRGSNARVRATSALQTSGSVEGIPNDNRPTPRHPLRRRQHRLPTLQVAPSRQAPSSAMHNKRVPRYAPSCTSGCQIQATRNTKSNSH